VSGWNAAHEKAEDRDVPPPTVDEFLKMMG